MKKFIIFTVVCFVALFTVFTTYYFILDREEIFVNDSILYANINESFLPEITIKNQSADTEMQFKSLHEDIVRFNTITNEFSASSGGMAVIEVSSTKEGFEPVYIRVSVGDGSLAAPYFIKSAEDLANVGTEDWPLSSNYILLNDIELSSFNDGEWIPIGQGEEPDDGFKGNFNFNNKTVSGLNITHTRENAGLFDTIHNSGRIISLNIINSNIYGDFESAGAVAGINHGSILRTRVGNSVTVNTISQTGYAGGITGMQLNNGDSYPRIDVVASDATVRSDFVAGGLIGLNYGGNIINSYSRAFISISDDSIHVPENTAKHGGIVGINTVKKNAESIEYKTEIINTYFAGQLTEGQLIGAIASKLEDKVDITNEGGLEEAALPVLLSVIVGNYYLGEEDNELKAISNIDNEVLHPSINISAEEIDDLRIPDTFISFIDEFSNPVRWPRNTWIFESGKLPTLDFERGVIAFNANTRLNTSSLNNPSDFYNKIILGEEGASTSFVIREDIDFSTITSFIPLGIEGNGTITPFYGSLTADNDPETGKPYVIKNITIPNYNEFSGLFAELAEGAEVYNLRFENINIKQGAYTGALAGVNNGTISNVTLENNLANTNIYINSNFDKSKYDGGVAAAGGLVGLNNGLIENSSAQAIIKTMPDGTRSRSFSAYAGGIVGYNNGEIILSSSNSRINAEGTSEAFAGGISGYNNSIISRTSFHGSIESATSANDSKEFRGIYLGGIVGFLDGNGIVSKSKLYPSSNIYGSQIGGIVGYSVGLVEECWSDGTLTGMFVGGIVANMDVQGSNRAITRDSMATAFLQGVSSNSKKAGFSLTVFERNNYYAIVERCIMDVTFDNVGENRIETFSPIRSGYVWNIADSEAGKVQRSVANLAKLTEDNGLIDRAFDLLNNIFMPDEDKPHYVDEPTFRGEDNTSLFNSLGYNSTGIIWSFVEGEIPTLFEFLED